MKCNKCNKCCIQASSKNPVNIKISNAEISKEDRAKLLEFLLDERLNFDFYVNLFLKKKLVKFTIT